MRNRLANHLLSLVILGLLLIWSAVSHAATITIQDTASTTATGQDSSSIVTGTPTAGSSVEQALRDAQFSMARFQVSGTWTGTLQPEISFDNTRWYAGGCRVAGGASAVPIRSITANGLLDCAVGGPGKIRLRAVAAITGTATIVTSLSLMPPHYTVAAVGAQVATQTVTIANGTSLSPTVDLGTYRLSRIAIPAAWTAANLTFKTSVDGSNFNDLYDSSGTEYSIVVGGASRSIIVPLADFIGVRYVQIRSGTTASPVNQGAARDLIVVSVP